MDRPKKIDGNEVVEHWTAGISIFALVNDTKSSPNGMYVVWMRGDGWMRLQANAGTKHLYDYMQARVKELEGVQKLFLSAKEGKIITTDGVTIGPSTFRDGSSMRFAGEYFDERNELRMRVKELEAILPEVIDMAEAWESSDGEPAAGLVQRLHALDAKKGV